MIEEKSRDEADRMRRTINMILQNTATPEGETAPGTLIFQACIERAEQLAGTGMSSITAVQVAYDEALAHAYLWRAAIISGCKTVCTIAQFQKSQSGDGETINQSVLMPGLTAEPEEACFYVMSSARALIRHVAAASGLTPQAVYEILGDGGFQDHPDLTIIHRHRTNPEGKDE